MHSSSMMPSSVSAPATAVGPALRPTLVSCRATGASSISTTHRRLRSTLRSCAGPLSWSISTTKNSSLSLRVSPAAVALSPFLIITSTHFLFSSSFLGYSSANALVPVGNLQGVSTGERQWEKGEGREGGKINSKVTPLRTYHDRGAPTPILWRRGHHVEGTLTAALLPPSCVGEAIM